MIRTLIAVFLPVAVALDANAALRLGTSDVIESLKRTTQKERQTLSATTEKLRALQDRVEAIFGSKHN